MCVIQFGGIWFVNGKFSASWKLVQAIVEKPKASLQGQCLLKPKQSDKDRLKTQQAVVEEDAVTFHTNVQVEDSDEEEEEMQVIEPPALSIKNPDTFVVDHSKSDADEVVEKQEDASVAVAPVSEDAKKKKIIRKKT